MHIWFDYAEKYPNLPTDGPMLPLLWRTYMSPLAHPSSMATAHSVNSSNLTADAFRLDAMIARHHATTPAPSNASSTDAAHTDLSPDARELALEIDRYKFRHRRRFINYEEILSVMKNLGYRKDFP